jgi:hypothetical protein
MPEEREAPPVCEVCGDECDDLFECTNCGWQMGECCKVDDECEACDGNGEVVQIT